MNDIILSVMQIDSGWDIERRCYYQRLAVDIELKDKPESRNRFFISFKEEMPYKLDVLTNGFRSLADKIEEYIQKINDST